MRKDYEYCDFDTIKEDWNEYEIEDGTTLRVKFVMVKIVRTKIPGVSDGYNYAFNSNNVVGVHSTKIRKPETRKYHPEELKKSVIKTDMKYKVKKEVWNKYRIKKDKTEISVKLVITDIQKTDKYDEYGDPHYLILTQPVFKATPPRKY
jgi:hypothetical protein